MAVSQSVLALSALQMPVRRLNHYQAAKQAMACYEKTLRGNALRRRAKGLAVTDQDQPAEAFCLCPPHPWLPPVVLIGGMGPLAGAKAFRRACSRFRNSRVVVLYQACSMPDRSAVILGENGPDTPVFREMAWQLADAVKLAVDVAGQTRQSARCIIACNSAHYFWRLLEENLRRTAPGQECEVRMLSLVASVLDALKLQGSRKTLVLAAEGARVGRVFSAPFRAAGISFEEPPPALSRLLMRAIFEGVKALDYRRAVELGNQFFEAILRTGQDYDCLLAGCTELPLTIDLLRFRGSPAVVAFLSRVKVIDPVEEALSRV